jgi:hypothetical protein
MSQFNAPVRRAGGDLDVYTGLLAVAFLVLAAGVFMLARNNAHHSGERSGEGGMLKLVEQRR